MPRAVYISLEFWDNGGRAGALAIPTRANYEGAVEGRRRGPRERSLAFDPGRGFLSGGEGAELGDVEGF